MIFKNTRYVSDDGMNLNYFEQADCPAGHKPMVKIQGIIQIETEMGLMPVEFPFPIGTTLLDAFANFESTARAYVERVKEDAPRVLAP